MLMPITYVLDLNKDFVEVNQYKVRRVCVFKKLASKGSFSILTNSFKF